MDALRHHRLATVKLPPRVRCVSLHSKDLQRLQSLTRAQLIDSAPVCYPETRAWAQAAFLQRPAAQAIAYTSRRDDSARCLMLFEQRLPDPPLHVVPEERLSIGPRRSEVMALVRSLRLREI